jgi:hypothetical protein
MTNLIAFLQSRLKTVVALSVAALGVIAVSSLLVDTRHAHSWVEQHIPFFWSLFGFAAASAIIGLARWFGGSGIQAPADIYDRTLTRICEDEE